MSQHQAVELGGRGVPTITDVTYASIAEELMKQYTQQHGNYGRDRSISTTKLRNIYSLIMNVYAQVNSSEEYARHEKDIVYLKVRMAYEAGREGSVKAFMKATHLMEYVDSITCLEQFMLYCRYAEALVAYFKYFEGRDS